MGNGRNSLYKIAYYLMKLNEAISAGSNVQGER
jgi:hypothetical protein